MWEAAAEAETGAAADSVWRLWADPGRWKEWNEQLASTDARMALARGATVRVRLKGSPLPLTFEVVAFEPGRLFTDETRLPGARMGHEHLVERAEGSTRIRNRLYVDGPAERLWALLLGRRMKAAVRRFVERERSLAEAESARTASEGAGRPSRLQ
jgi:hypothetical protein